LRDRRPPRLLRRPHPGDLALWHLHPRGPSLQEGQQGPQTRPVPLRVRRTERPRLQGLLRPQDQREEEAQPSPDRPGQTPLRCAVRNAPRRHLLLPAQRPHGSDRDSRLTPAPAKPAAAPPCRRPQHDLIHELKRQTLIPAPLTKNIGTPPCPTPPCALRASRGTRRGAPENQMTGPGALLLDFCGA